MLSRSKRSLAPRACAALRQSQLRAPLSTQTASEETLLDNAFQTEMKLMRKQRNKEPPKYGRRHLEGWKITCGLEIHAQLNTPRKLFSRAQTSHIDEPNTHVALFDLAAPGSQPVLQKTTLLPALKAALAFQCKVNTESRFDRKHYFYWDQPAGYQITQYYKPLATDGFVRLSREEDGINEDELLVGIKQVQIEQDTAKTITQPGFGDEPPNHLIDYNRVSHPLVEIITTPCIHSPAVAGLIFAKIQAIMKAVGSSVLGMEWGGMRCDVNVSVSREGTTELGQRCEIKNLSSIKAVEEAVGAEAVRQIEQLEKGGIILGETRGWDENTKTTRRLRGKEGEVDYRYMPDPDIPPLLLSNELISHLRDNLPLLPNQHFAKLTSTEFGLTPKDAKTLIYFQDENLLFYYYDVVKHVSESLEKKRKDLGVVCGNWVIHNLLGVLTTGELPFAKNPLTARNMGDLISLVLEDKLTGTTAKTLLNRLVFESKPDEKLDIMEIVTKEKLLTAPISDSELVQVVERVFLSDEVEATKMREKLFGIVTENARNVDKKRKGLENWFMGKVMREMGGKVQGDRLGAAIRRAVDAESEKRRN